MSDDLGALVRHLEDLPVEQWEEPGRGGATWRTLFSRHVTATEALSTGVSEVPAGGRLTPHRHETVESYFFLEGRGVLTLGTEEHDVGPGSSVLIPSSTRHGVRNVGTATLRFFYVFATDSFTDVEYDFPDEPT